VNAEHFGYVQKLVYEYSAIVLEEGKEYLVETRLNPLARRMGYSALGELLEELRQGPVGSLHLQVIEAMTTNETSFFRDLKMWAGLRTVLLPELMTRRSAARSLRVWSAACSSGQEIYTFSILLRENFPSLSTWNLTLLATDLSSEMVARAASGEFSSFEVNRGLPTPLLLKYFRQAEGKWHLLDALRKPVEFREFNLLRSFRSLGAMDLVFMRNVLIYFDQETKRAILDRVLELIGDQGFLILGAAETPVSVHDGFRPFEAGGMSAYCKR